MSYPPPAARHPFIPEFRKVVTVMATILIVDDSPTIRLTVGMMLSKKHTIHAAVHGQDALKKLSENAIELVICDVHMPVMGGLEFLRSVRADARYHPLPVIMLTQTSSLQDRETAEALGANAFLLKPVSSWELLATVNRFIHYKGHLATPESEALPIDKEVLLSRMANDEQLMEGFLAEALPLFCEETTMILDTLNEALPCGDVEQVKRQCHALMGSSATVGAIDLSSSCFELEMAVRSGNLDELPQHLAQIQTHFAQIRAYTQQVTAVSARV